MAISMILCSQGSNRVSPELLQLIVQAGGFGVAVWMLNNVWTELKVQNQRIFQLLTDREVAKAERAEIDQQIKELRSLIAPQGETRETGTTTRGTA